MTERPVPTPDPATAPYWQAARDHTFKLPRCLDCGKTHFYPRAICPHCRSARLEWIEASGRGTVFSFTVVQRAPSPAFQPLVPYTVAIVALVEGPHLMTNIVDVAPAEVRIGMPVRVRYLDLEDDARLPVFAPAEA